MKCKCGCGGDIILKPYHKKYGIPDYISGHNQKAKPYVRTDETRKKNGDANRGKWMTLSCTNCKKEINRLHSKENNFCSHECFYIWRKGKSGWSKGLTKESDIRVTKISKGVKKTHKHQKPWLGKKRSEEDIQKFSISHLGKKDSEATKRNKSIRMKKEWDEMDEVKKSNRIRKSLTNARKSPNECESFVFRFLKTLIPKEYEINTKGEIMVLGRKVPDFVNVNGKKKLIEFFGEYYHKPEDEKKRIDFFKQFGWDTLVIWGKDLKNQEQLKNKIVVFTEA